MVESDAYRCMRVGHNDLTSGLRISCQEPRLLNSSGSENYAETQWRATRNSFESKFRSSLLFVVSKTVLVQLYSNNELAANFEGLYSKNASSVGCS